MAVELKASSVFENSSFYPADCLTTHLNKQTQKSNHDQNIKQVVQVYIIHEGLSVTSHTRTWPVGVGAVEYIDCFSAEGQDHPPHHECPWYNTKLSDGEVGAVENEEYPFIDIASRSSLTRSSSIRYGPIIGFGFFV